MSNENIFENITLEDFDEQPMTEDHCLSNAKPMTEDHCLSNAKPTQETEQVEQPMTEDHCLSNAKPTQPQNIVRPSRPPRPCSVALSQMRRPVSVAPPSKPQKQIHAAVIQNVDFKQVYDSISVPTLEQFCKSNAVYTIMWLIKNCHRDKLGKIMSGKGEHKDITNITPEVFKQMLKSLYTDFVYIHRLQQFINLVKSSYTDYKITKDGLKVRRGNTLLFTADEDTHYKEVNNRYKKTMTELYMNVDLSKLTTSKILELFKLPIFSTSNAYEVNNPDFHKFGFSFDNREITYDDFNITEEQKAVMYHELFNKLTIGKPFAVFNRRASFASLVSDDIINANIASCLEEFKQFDYNNVVNGIKTPPSEDEFKEIIELLTFMFNTDTFKNIMFKAFVPNVLVKELLNTIFKSKAFVILLDNCLWSISYLFSPRCFMNDELKALMANKSSQSLVNRRKLMVNYLLSTDNVSAIKNNQWWVNIVVNPSCLDNNDNLWFTTIKDIEKEQQRLIKKQKTKATTEQPNEDNGNIIDADDFGVEVDL